MDTLIKCIKMATEYDNPESSNKFKELNSLIGRKPDWLPMKEDEKIFEETIEYINEIGGSGKEFCRPSRGIGMDTTYLVEEVENPNNSVLFYYSPKISSHEDYPERKEVIAVVVYTYENYDKNN